MTKSKGIRTAVTGTGTGRRSRLTPEVAAGIVLAVRAGDPFEVAAATQGIPRATFWDWMHRGETEGRDPYTDFSDRVRRAEAEAHTLFVGSVRRAAIDRNNWQAALAYLKMRWPNHYAERIEHTGPGGGPIALEIAQALEGLRDDELASIDRFLAEAAAGSAAEPNPG
jgi:hypothetical protein